MQTLLKLGLALGGAVLGKGHPSTSNLRLLMQTLLKIGLGLGAVALGYAMFYGPSLKGGDEVLVTSAAFPGATTSPEVAALVPPGAQIAVRVTRVDGDLFSGQVTGFVFTDNRGNRNFTSLAGGPLLPNLSRKGIVGKR